MAEEKAIREKFDLQAAMEAEEKEWASRPAKPPRVWTCYVCRKEETWREGWACFNSMRGQEDGEPLIVTCSEACRNTRTDKGWGKDLFRLFDKTGYVEPPPQFGNRMYKERKPSKKRKDAKEVKNPAKIPTDFYGRLYSVIVDCPNCKAHRGERCISEKGRRFTSGHHSDRATAARRWKQKNLVKWEALRNQLLNPRVPAWGLQ